MDTNIPKGFVKTTLLNKVRGKKHVVVVVYVIYSFLLEIDSSVNKT